MLTTSTGPAPYLPAPAAASGAAVRLPPAILAAHAARKALSHTDTPAGRTASRGADPSPRRPVLQALLNRLKNPG